MNYTVTKATGFWEHWVVFRILQVVSDITLPNSQNPTLYHGRFPTTVCRHYFNFKQDLFKIATENIGDIQTVSIDTVC